MWGQFLHRLNSTITTLQYPPRSRGKRIVHCDYRAFFEASGAVEDSDTKIAIADARVIFIDVSLDSQLSVRGAALSRTVGRSDATGKIASQFEYFWGEDKEAPGSPEGEFRLRIEASRYKAEVLRFQLSTLPRSGAVFTVDIDTVLLRER